MTYFQQVLWEIWLFEVEACALKATVSSPFHLLY